MKQSFFFFYFFIIIFPEGAFQRQYNYLLSTEEKKINWLILTTAIRMLIIKREKSTTE